MLCNKNFITKYAKVDGITISIDDFTHDQKVMSPRCNNNHELIAVQGKYNKWHFRHAHTSDVDPTNGMSEWHAEWQSNFENTEVCFTTEGQIKHRRADIVEGEYVIEIQHSIISGDEVDNRNKDYKLNGKKVKWIIDGNSLIDLTHTQDGSIMTFKEIWAYDSFKNCNEVYIDKMGYIYKININDVQSCQIIVSNPTLKEYFIPLLKVGKDIMENISVQSKIFIKQQGAGNGKTWGIINMIGRESFSHYKTFIYVTKQHSARNIIKEEFINQQDSLGITNVEYKEKNKKYIIEYTNNNGLRCSIIISTIDSFMYAIGDKTLNSFDMFEGIVGSIIKKHLEIDIKGTIQYASINPKLNSETLYILDETQDLQKMYAEAIVEIQKHTNLDVYIVGDKLQSISNEISAFDYFMGSKPIIEEPINICRRFTHPVLIDFVNHMVPFKKYELKEVTPYQQINETNYPLRFLFQPSQDNDKITEKIEEIMICFKQEVEEHHYLPENFLVVTPIVGTNSLVNALDMAINDFWIDHFKTHSIENYYRYSVFHKSEEGTSINLDESSHSTRIVSIHSSKGDGREVVFVIGLTDFKLRIFSGLKESLKYDSLLHVAITRMKKSLYITYKDDYIGNKIKSFLDKTGQDYPIDELLISPIIKTRDIIRISGEELNKECLLLYDDSSVDTHIVDMAHHNIRFGIMYITICEQLMNETFDRCSQIKVVFNNAHTYPIHECETWRNYNTMLKNINGTKEKNYKDAFKCIPILKIKNNEYLKYYKIIIEMMQHIQTNPKKLCPLEQIILYYMIQVTKNSTRTKITMIELYNIINIYSRSYKSTMVGHDNCLCKKCFNDNTHDLTDYLLTHYEKMNKLESIVQILKIKHPNTNWNIDHTICIGHKQFTIKGDISVIGYNETSIILCYITPQLNKLNFNVIKTKAIIDVFIIKNVSIECDNYTKYNGKQIFVCIIALNINEPYFMDINTTPKIKQILHECLHDYYSVKNKDVYRYYKYYMEKGLSIPDICSKYKDTNKKLIYKKPYQENANYITSFIHKIS